MILPILKHPNKRLHIVADPVEEYEFDSDMSLYLTVQNMFETMLANDGIGLAATQVDIHKRIIVMKVSEPICIINPIINSLSGQIEFNEGCLSFPNLRIKKSRAYEINISYRDVCGNHITRSFIEKEAVCVQHEIDHINAITFNQNKKVDKSTTNI